MDINAIRVCILRRVVMRRLVYRREVVAVRFERKQRLSTVPRARKSGVSRRLRCVSSLFTRSKYTRAISVEDDVARDMTSVMSC